MKKFKNQYRIPSARLRSWDYGQNGAYFVTICTKNRECYFGAIENGNMIISEIGHIAGKYWAEIPNHFPFVQLGKFIIMPNHVHGIIIIDKSDNDGNAVETQNFASLQQQHNHPKNKFGPQSQNLASIIRGYKSGVKKYSTMNYIEFTWRSRFHDHIIRNEKSFNEITEYVKTNAQKWKNDKFYADRDNRLGGSRDCRDAKFCVSTPTTDKAVKLFM